MTANRPEEIEQSCFPMAIRTYYRYDCRVWKV
jgi:hypothetical protein